jgi:hypothetical protein
MPKNIKLLETLTFFFFLARGYYRPNISKINEGRETKGQNKAENWVSCMIRDYLKLDFVNEQFQSNVWCREKLKLVA